MVMTNNLIGWRRVAIFGKKNRKFCCNETKGKIVVVGQNDLTSWSHVRFCIFTNNWTYTYDIIGRLSKMIRICFGMCKYCLTNGRDWCYCFGRNCLLYEEFFHNVQKNYFWFYEILLIRGTKPIVWGILTICTTSISFRFKKYFVINFLRHKSLLQRDGHMVINVALNQI